MTQNSEEPHKTAPARRRYQPVFNVPWSVLLLLGSFALVHFIRSLLTPEQDLAVIINCAFIPARYIDGFLASGVTGATSFITYNFLHGDITHLGVNSVWLLAMGSPVARRIGSVRFFLFSAVCGIFAALAHLVTHFGDVAPVIGASGAISGHMAAAIRFVFSVDNSREGFGMMRSNLRAIPLKSLKDAMKDGRVLAVLVIWLVTNVVSGIGVIPVDNQGTTIAWEAHIGGFFAGLLLFSLFDLPGNGRSSTPADLPESPGGDV